MMIVKIVMKPKVMGASETLSDTNHGQRLPLNLASLTIPRHPGGTKRFIAYILSRFQLHCLFDSWVMCIVALGNINYVVDNLL